MSRAPRNTAIGGIAGWIILFVLLWQVMARAAPPQQLRVAGTPKRIGQTIGSQDAAALGELHPRFLIIAQAIAGQDKATLYARAHKIEPFIDEPHRAEMRAIAGASGLTYDDVLFLNCFYTLTNRHTLACRQLAAWGKATAGGTGGELLHARNLDWVDYPGQPLDKHHLILDITPSGKTSGGRRHVLLTWPGLMGAVTGTNDAGITLGFNQLMEGDKVDRLAEPTFFTLRRVLEQATTLQQAIDIIEKARPLDNGSVLISSATEKQAAVVEIIDGLVGVRRPPDGESMIGNANHPTKEAGWKNLPGAWDCDWPTCTVARRLKTPITVKQAQRIMSDPMVMQGRINMLSVIFDPSHKKMYLSVRPTRAASGPFTEYDLFGEAKQ
ncbi:MAG: C45 family autoproteolytic acyltransferase/hydrolase [Phycisphaerales bacterium]